MRARLHAGAVVLTAFALSACELALGLGDLHGTSASGTGASSTSSSSGGDAGHDAFAMTCGEPGSVSSLWGTLTGTTPAPAWTSGTMSGSFTEMDGSVSLVATGSNARAAYGSAKLVSMIGCSISIEITPEADAGDTEEYLAITDATNDENAVAIVIEGTTINFATQNVACTDGGPCDPTMTATYDPSLDHYVRLAESGGTLSFETSLNGTAWASRSTVPTPTWASSVQVSFGIDGPATQAATASVSATFSNVAE